MHSLIGAASVGDGLPTTVWSAPRRQGSDLILTLLHYIPVRKALDIDVIEERMSFAGEVLRLDASRAQVHQFGSDEPLPQNEEGGFVLPAKKGRLLLEVPGFFNLGA